MSDTAAPEPTAGEPTVGDRVDQAIADLRAEISPKIDNLQAGLDALSARVDEIQASGQGAPVEGEPAPPPDNPPPAEPIDQSQTQTQPPPSSV